MMPRRRAHTGNDMETNEKEETTPVPALRRSERLAPSYGAVEAKHSGDKLIRNQRLVLSYKFSSDGCNFDFDDERIPAQEAHSHDSSVQPDNGVHGPGKLSQPKERVLPIEPISFRRKQRKQIHPNRAALPG